MKKNKLSRIEDFILPTFFLYQYNMFEYPHNFRYKPKSFKTKLCKNVLEQKLEKISRIGIFSMSEPVQSSALSRFCLHYKAKTHSKVWARRTPTSFAPTLWSESSLCNASAKQKIFIGKNRKVINKHLGKGTFFAKLAATNRTGLCSHECGNVGSFACTSLQTEGLHAQPTLLPIAPLVQRNAPKVQRNEFIIISRKICHQEITKIFLHSTYKTSYTITRPVINCPRKTITMICRLSRLPVYPDLTNSKVRYARNRIRKQIIPTLQLFLNPKVEKALFKFSEFYNKAF